MLPARIADHVATLHEETAERTAGPDLDAGKGESRGSRAVADIGSDKGGTAADLGHGAERKIKEGIAVAAARGILQTEMAEREPGADTDSEGLGTGRILSRKRGRAKEREANRTARALYEYLLSNCV